MIKDKSNVTLLNQSTVKIRQHCIQLLELYEDLKKLGGKTND